MKAILEFNLDEPDDQMAHIRCIKSLDLVLAIWDFQRHIIELIKNGDGMEDITEVSQAFSEMLQEHGIKLDELIR